MKNKGLLILGILILSFSFISGDTLNVPGDHTTIQEAIDAANSGDTIIVGAGVYSEQIKINKNLVLEGEMGVIIEAPALPRNVYTLPEASRTVDPIIIVFGGIESSGAISGSGVINVELRNLEIDGKNNFGSNRYYGILSRNANLLIEEISIHSIGIDGIETFGIVIYGDSECVVKDSTITGFSRGGIGILGDGDVSPSPSCDVLNNVVLGPGTGPVTWAPNGIQVSYGATANIENNNVSACGWPGTAWAGTCILAGDTSNVKIKNNHVYNCEQAIGIGDYPSSWGGIFALLTSSNFIVSNNKIENNDWGISVFNDITKVDILNNQILLTINDAIDVYNYGYGGDEDPTEITIKFNTIMGSGGDGLWIGGSITDTINAEYNYWGSCDGPSGDGSGMGDTVIGNADYTPWFGICMDGKIGGNCAFETDNVTLRANLTGIEIDRVWFSYSINGDNYTPYASKGPGNSYYIAIPSSQLVGGHYVFWEVYANDTLGIIYSNGLESFYVRNRTKLMVDPLDPDGIDEWYVNEPEFTLTKDGDDGNISYRWNGGNYLNYTSPFGLEDSTNDGNITGGTLVLKYKSDVCNEKEKQKAIKYDVAPPVIRDIYPEENEIIFDNFKPKIEILIDEIDAGNSGINLTSVIMKINGSLVDFDIKAQDLQDANLTYTPSENLDVGMYEIYVYAEDKAGRSAERNWTFELREREIENLTMNIFSPISKNYNARRIPFNITINRPVKLEYIDYSDSRPTWRRLCLNCEEYGHFRTKLLNFREGQHQIIIKATDEYGKVEEQGIEFFIDSISPRIIRTEPRRGFADGNFHVEFREVNPINLILFYTDGLVERNQSVEIENCILERTRYVCEKEVDLSEFNGTKIRYWYELTDIAENKGISKEIFIDVDTSPPIINDINHTVNRRRVFFKFDIEEKNFKEITYIDWNDRRPREVRICSRLKNGICEITRSFNLGEHNLTFSVYDKAGNFVTENRNFTIS